jgi:hypothetical protein
MSSWSPENYCALPRAVQARHGRQIGAPNQGFIAPDPRASAGLVPALPTGRQSKSEGSRPWVSALVRIRYAGEACLARTVPVAGRA